MGRNKEFYEPQKMLLYLNLSFTCYYSDPINYQIVDHELSPDTLQLYMVLNGIRKFSNRKLIRYGLLHIYSELRYLRILANNIVFDIGMTDGDHENY